MISIKISLFVGLLLQATIAMTIPASVEQGSFNEEVAQIPLEEPKQMHTEQQQHPLEEDESDLMHPEETMASIEADIEKPQNVNQHNRNFPQDIDTFPLDHPKPILASLTDVQKIQREQLLAFVMSQFVYYVQSIVHESELKLPNVLNDFQSLEDFRSSDLFGLQKDNIDKYLKQINNYKSEAQQFLAKTLNILKKYQQLVEELETKASGDYELEQLLQQYELSNLGRVYGEYLKKFWKLFNQEFQGFSTDLSALGKEADNSFNNMAMNLYNQPGLINPFEDFSALLSF